MVIIFAFAAETLLRVGRSLPIAYCAGPVGVNPSISLSVPNINDVGPYCKADDLVSLAYVILSLALMASPPWFQQLQNSWTVMDQGGELSCKTVIATRKRCLQELRHSGEVEGLILDFITYTEQLRPNQTPDYDKWTKQFDLAAAVAEGAGEVYSHML